jgi:translin
VVPNLEAVVDRIMADLTQKSAIRDATLARSRALIRLCANSIRATHRHEYDLAKKILDEAKAAAATMCAEAQAYPDVYYAGYLQDAMKELAEAAITLDLVVGEELPNPEDLSVDYPAYLNGLGEAVGEMRRFALDAIRRGDTAEAERILDIMDEVYSFLVIVDFPDSMTGGLRRTTDMVRGVTERTRGDLTTSVRQDELQARLVSFEERIKGLLGKDV